MTRGVTDRSRSLRLRLRRPRRTPQLSVIVPVYNVADFLAASLDSILRQPFSDIEVIMVDDGSTDGSTAIAEEYAARHRKVTLIRQPNSGVSVARNTAIAACRGRFVTFVDPDDELPPDAWSTMMRTLERTGSDFVVGSAERLTADGPVAMPLMRRNHRIERLGITIDDAPMMLADVFVWNKIFRRDFWDDHGIWFPEHTRYQDQVALTQAFLACSSFDVLTEVVYEWRMRADKSSATQRRAEISNLVERITTKRMTVDLVREHESADVMQVLRTEILPIDMWEHFRAAVLPSTPDPDRYWTILRDAVREFWNDSTVPFEQTLVPVRQRLMGWLVAEDRRDDLIRLIDFIDSHPEGIPVTDGEYAHPWSDDPELPSALARVAR
jgi:glycosyltransferase involved in cell wall biosynthesis